MTSLNSGKPRYSELLAKLEESFISRWFELSDNSPHELWHYTNAGGLLGILQHNQLWLSDNIFMNDSAEMNYAVKIIQEVITEYTEKTHSDLIKHYLKLILLNVEENVKNDAEFSFLNSVFICCFCEQEDSLHLWRAYTNNGQGYSIGLFVDRIINRMTPIKIVQKTVREGKLNEKWHSYDPYLCRVIYQKEEQRRIISALLDDFISALSSEPDAFSTETNQLVVANTSDRVYALLFRCLFMFKDPSFSEEKEWRLVYAKRFSSALKSDPNAKETDLNYRQSGNYFLPYLKVDVGRDLEDSVLNENRNIKKLPFERIIVGPALDANLARSAINSYIYRNAYLGYNVFAEASKVTLRSL